MTPYMVDFGAEISAPAGQGNIPLVQMERASGPTERAAMCAQRFNVFGDLGGKAGGIALTNRHEDPTGLPITSVGSALKLVMYQVLQYFGLAVPWAMQFVFLERGGGCLSLAC